MNISEPLNISLDWDSYVSFVNKLLLILLLFSSTCLLSQSKGTDGNGDISLARADEIRRGMPTARDIAQPYELLRSDPVARRRNARRADVTPNVNYLPVYSSIFLFGNRANPAQVAPPVQQAQQAQKNQQDMTSLISTIREGNGGSGGRKLSYYDRKLLKDQIDNEFQRKLTGGKLNLTEYNVNIGEVYTRLNSGTYIPKYDNYISGTNNEERLAKGQSTYIVVVSILLALAICSFFWLINRKKKKLFFEEVKNKI